MSLIVSEVYDALIEAGASEAKAKAAAGAIPLAEHSATKDDLAEVRAEIAEPKADISGLEARFSRQLWVMAAVIVGLNVTSIKLLD